MVGSFSLSQRESCISSAVSVRPWRGTGRSCIIREDGRIVAHTAAYAETERYAVVSGTIVHPHYRDRGYYPVISSYIAAKLAEEGKRVFTFASSPRMIAYHDRMDRRCGSYGKLMPEPAQ